MTTAPSVAAPIVNVTTAASTASAPDSFKDVLGDVSGLSVDFGAADPSAEPAPMPVDAAPVDGSVPPVPDAAPVATPPATPQLDMQAQFQQFALQMQQTQQMFMAQQQQAMAEMIRQFPQMMAQVLPRQPEAPPPDPYAGLDPNDPDYHFSRLGIENKMLSEKLAKVEAWRDKFEQEIAAEQRQQQQTQQQQAQQSYVRNEVQRSVVQLFNGVDRTPEVEELFQLACEQMDREWSQTGYQQNGAARGWQAAKRLTDRFLPLLRAQASAKATPQNQQPPVGGNRPQGLASPAQLGEDPFDRMRRTRDADAAELSAIFRNVN